MGLCGGDWFLETGVGLKKKSLAFLFLTHKSVIRKKIKTVKNYMFDFFFSPRVA